VGHDWGANVAWNAAMMRPDRFKAVFCLAVPYSPRGKASVLDAMKAAGHGNDFYMFEQIRPDADQIWANAAVTIPGVLYWASGSAPAAEAWNPFDPARSLHRKAPDRLPAWIEADYLAHNIAEFQRTGFHGALNYYRAVQPYFNLSGAYRAAKILQPAYFVWGKSDGLFPIYHLTEAKLRDQLPGLAGYVGLDGVGHWVQHEAADQVSEQLVSFARSGTRITSTVPCTTETRMPVGSRRISNLVPTTRTSLSPTSTMKGRDGFFVTEKKAMPEVRDTRRS